MSTDPKPHRRTAEEILADEYLLARSRILDLAAFLDRIDNAPGSADESHPMPWLTQGLEILCDDEIHKARRIQLLMSREYDPAWRKKYGLH